MTRTATIAFLLYGGAAVLLLCGCAARLDSNMESKLTGIEEAIAGIGNRITETTTSITALGSQVTSTQNDLSYAQDAVKYGTLGAVALGLVAMLVFVRVFKAAIASAVCKFQTPCQIEASHNERKATGR